jgi:hypothetical protein
MRIRDISIRFVSILAVATAFGPTGCNSQKSETFTVQDQGELCLFPEAEPNGNAAFMVDPATARDYGADQVVNVAVALVGCLSGSCDVDRTASCSVQTVAGAPGVMRVTSTGSYRATGANACTTDCGILTARCVTPVLPPGSYTFLHGDMNLQIGIPSSVPPPCVGSWQ